VIGRLNDSTGPNLGPVFSRFTDWRRPVRPTWIAGRFHPGTTPVHSWDIFIGLLGNRFGAPSGRSDPDTGAPSCRERTERIFMLAYRSWKKWGRPENHVLRCERPLKDERHRSEKQLLQVEDFFQSLSFWNTTGIIPVCIRSSRVPRAVDTHVNKPR